MSGLPFATDGVEVLRTVPVSRRTTSPEIVRTTQKTPPYFLKRGREGEKTKVKHRKRSQGPIFHVRMREIEWV